MPTEEVKAWAQTKPGFEEIWIDRDHGGWITVAFSSDAAARQAELPTAFPGVGVVVVEVDWDIAQLRTLQQRVAEELSGKLGSMSVGVDIKRGKVEVGLGVLSEDRIDVVENRFRGEPICVSGLDPSDAIPEAPQPTSGDGWRLLTAEDGGDVYRTDIATDESSYRKLWKDIGLKADRPPVDFEDEVVIWFGAVYGSTCPNLRLDDVIVDDQRRIIHSLLVIPTVNGGCTDDASPRAYVVAVERSTLPAPPFAIQLRAEDDRRGAQEERTIVEIDLREPGRVAGPGDAHRDLSSIQEWWVQSGDVIEPDYPAIYRLEARCGVEWLGRLNWVSWRTGVPPGVDRFIPAAWEPLVEDGALVVSVLMRIDPEPSLTATAAGHTVEYLPTLAPVPDC
jgi:hypothetical protein